MIKNQRMSTRKEVQRGVKNQEDANQRSLLGLLFKELGGEGQEGLNLVASVHVVGRELEKEGSKVLCGWQIRTSCPVMYFERLK